jgi:hypothetical protein
MKMFRSVWYAHKSCEVNKEIEGVHPAGLKRSICFPIDLDRMRVIGRISEELEGKTMA